MPDDRKCKVGNSEGDMESKGEGGEEEGERRELRWVAGLFFSDQRPLSRPEELENAP